MDTRNARQRSCCRLHTSHRCHSCRQVELQVSTLTFLHSTHCSPVSAFLHTPFTLLVGVMQVQILSGLQNAFSPHASELAQDAPASANRGGTHWLPSSTKLAVQVHTPPTHTDCDWQRRDAEHGVPGSARSTTAHSLPYKWTPGRCSVYKPPSLVVLCPMGMCRLVVRIVSLLCNAPRLLDTHHPATQSVDTVV